jgi:hypothetical protein
MRTRPSHDSALIEDDLNAWTPGADAMRWSPAGPDSTAGTVAMLLNAQLYGRARTRDVSAFKRSRNVVSTRLRTLLGRGLVTRTKALTGART